MWKLRYCSNQTSNKLKMHTTFCFLDTLKENFENLNTFKKIRYFGKTSVFYKKLKKKWKLIQHCSLFNTNKGNSSISGKIQDSMNVFIFQRKTLVRLVQIFLKILYSYIMIWVLYKNSNIVKCIQKFDYIWIWVFSQKQHFVFFWVFKLKNLLYYQKKKIIVTTLKIEHDFVWLSWF